jgi:acyl carrier protein
VTTQARQPAPSKPAIQDWLKRWIAAALSVPAEEIETFNSLLDYSLSSVTATMLVGDLEDWLGLTLPPTLVWDYPSIDALAEHLSCAVANEAETAPSQVRATGESVQPVTLTEVLGKDARRLLSELDQLSDHEVSTILDQLLAQEQAQAAESQRSPETQVRR